jgi:hypothetical protein
MSRSRALNLSRSSITMQRMVMIWSAEGPRSIDDRDVVFVYRDSGVSRYCQATLVLSNGQEVSGRALVAAVDKLAAKLDDKPLPPVAA